WLAEAAGAESPRYTPVIIADRSVGLHMANAVCAALYRREKTGLGQRVDVPMFESLLQSVLGEHLGGQTYVPPTAPPGYGRMLAKERRPYRTKDGYLCVLVYNDKQWHAFFGVIGRPDLQRDPRYATQEARSRDYQGAYSMVAEEIAKRGTAEWLAALEAADIPVQKMNSLQDILADPHLAAIGYFQEREHPTEGRIRTMAVPSEWSESPPAYRRHAPQLGEHTREILQQAGYADDAIERLMACGAAL
ncbi:MAG: CoA transferase, partial [Betaproteobacteria bacterium]|nr:CoA transferase [Betaproteobacteria bacterium]